MPRRSLLKFGFWSAVGGMVVAAGFTFIRFIYPKLDDPARFTVAPGEVPEPGGDPLFHPAGRFYLVNLEPDEKSGGPTQEFIDEGPGGLVALSIRCPHLNCSVKGPDVVPSIARDWPNCFRCPCHGSTFTKAGVRVFGPAHSGLDTGQCVVSNTGSVTVDMSRPVVGDDDNPQRVVVYPF